MHLYAVKLAGVAPCLALRVLTVHAATRSAVALTQLPCTVYTSCKPCLCFLLLVVVSITFVTPISWLPTSYSSSALDCS